MKVAMSRSSMRQLIGVGVPALLAASIVISSGVAQPRDKPQDKADGRGVFLRFFNRGEAGHLQNPPHLGLSFGGRQLRAVMDTGSTGIVVSASAIPNIDRLPNRGPGTLTYTSSGRIERGDWVVVRATIAGANGASVTTLPIPVLAVRSVACLDNARNCTVREDPRHVAMIGVGFGRRGNREGPHGPDINPLLNLPGSDRSGLRRGYIVSSAGVQIGLSAADPGDGYVTEQLTRDDAREDWSGAPACIAIDDRTPACGTALPDTGVAGMFLSLPASDEQAAGSGGGDRGLSPGTKVTILLAPEASASGAASYSFRIGDLSNPLAPARVTLVSRGDRPTFVNTGVHVLNGFDYLFDADKGVVGYRWNGRLSAR
jgi:hypothetical protein